MYVSLIYAGTVDVWNNKLRRVHVRNLSLIPTNSNTALSKKDRAMFVEMQR